MAGAEQRIAELLGVTAAREAVDWQKMVASAQCPFLQRRCVKTRKSDPSVVIGTCTVQYGRADGGAPLMICPHRLLENGKIFTDTVHLLTHHEPGNDLFVVSEFTVPGGSVDYVIVSARRGKPVDFVGLEIQTLDTTGTVWPARQRFLAEKGIALPVAVSGAGTAYGINWKMSAKTILVQMHHKIGTFEHLNRKLVLVLQDRLLLYMANQFSFDHLSYPASIGDSLHFHGYSLVPDGDHLTLDLAVRGSTDEAGMATALGLQASSRVELESIMTALEAKLANATRITLAGP